MPVPEPLPVPVSTGSATERRPPSRPVASVPHFAGIFRVNTGASSDDSAAFSA